MRILFSCIFLLAGVNALQSSDNTEALNRKQTKKTNPSSYQQFNDHITTFAKGVFRSFVEGKELPDISPVKGVISQIEKNKELDNKNTHPLFSIMMYAIAPPQTPNIEISPQRQKNYTKYVETMQPKIDETIAHMKQESIWSQITGNNDKNIQHIAKDLQEKFIPRIQISLANLQQKTLQQLSDFLKNAIISEIPARVWHTAPTGNDSLCVQLVQLFQKQGEVILSELKSYTNFYPVYILSPILTVYPDQPLESSYIITLLSELMSDINNVLQADTAYNQKHLQHMKNLTEHIILLQLVPTCRNAFAGITNIQELTKEIATRILHKKATTDELVNIISQYTTQPDTNSVEKLQNDLRITLDNIFYPDNQAWPISYVIDAIEEIEDSKQANISNVLTEIHNIIDVFYRYGGAQQFTKPEPNKSTSIVEQSDIIKQWYESKIDVSNELDELYGHIQYLTYQMQVLS